MAKGADETMFVFEARELRIERMGVVKKKNKTKEMDTACC